MAQCLRSLSCETRTIAGSLRLAGLTPHADVSVGRRRLPSLLPGKCTWFWQFYVRQCCMERTPCAPVLNQVLFLRKADSAYLTLLLHSPEGEHLP